MHVVVIGGGSGLFQAIKAVRPIAKRLSVIVPTCGDDGADALIRRLGAYPGVAGVVNVLMQMSRDAAMQRLMQQQFPLLGTPYDRIPFGVMQLLASAQSLGSLPDAIEGLRQQLRCDIDVLMACDTPHDVVTQTSDERTHRGTSQFAQPLSAPVQTVLLDPPVAANPAALKVLRVADMVLIAPGSLYRTVLPALLPTGIGETLRSLAGKVICCGALTTVSGQTDAFRAVDYVARIARALGRGAIDVALLNSHQYTTAAVTLLKQRYMAPLRYESHDAHVLNALDIQPVARDMLINITGNVPALLPQLTIHDEAELRMGIVTAQRVG
jgi:2-phospho-L-lactate transferase/gluconeogenesis factor (CofD/UPF0052 family)